MPAVSLTQEQNISDITAEIRSKISGKSIDDGMTIVIRELVTLIIRERDERIQGEKP